MSDWAIVSIVVIVCVVVLALAMRRRVTGVEIAWPRGIKAKVTAKPDTPNAGTKISENSLQGTDNSIRSSARGPLEMTGNRLRGTGNAIEISHDPPAGPARQ